MKEMYPLAPLGCQFPDCQHMTLPCVLMIFLFFFLIALLGIVTGMSLYESVRKKGEDR